MDATTTTIERLRGQEKVLTRLLAETRMDLGAAQMIQGARTEKSKGMTLTMTAPVPAKRGPGRPKRIPVAIAEFGPTLPKRGPGRPRKVQGIDLAIPQPETPKRGPGRPRKVQPEPAVVMPKRGPGRPRKNPIDLAIPKVEAMTGCKSRTKVQTEEDLLGMFASVISEAEAPPKPPKKESALRKLIRTGDRF